GADARERGGERLCHARLDVYASNRFKISEGTESRRSYEWNLASIFDDALVYPYVLGCRLIPGEVLRHAALHDLRPLFFIAERAERTVYRVQEGPRTVAPELEASAAAIRLLVNGVVQAAGGANHGDGAVFQAVDLVEAARLVA